MEEASERPEDGLNESESVPMNRTTRHLERSRNLLVAIALFSCSLSVSAQDNPAANPFPAQWPAMCTEMIKRVLSPTELKLIIEKMPVKEEPICNCIEASMRNDRLLKVLWSADLLPVRDLIKQPGFEPYFMGKMMSITMACVAPALETSANAMLP